MDRIDRDFPVDDTTTTDAGKRGASRDSLFLIAPIRFEGDDDVTEVRVRNLSPGGLMAEIGRVVPIGPPGVVGLGGVGGFEGQIAGCAEGRGGGVQARQVRFPEHGQARERRPVRHGRRVDPAQPLRIGRGGERRRQEPGEAPEEVGLALGLRARLGCPGEPCASPSASATRRKDEGRAPSRSGRPAGRSAASGGASAP